MKKSHHVLFHLPEEIIEIIVSRLPVKSLLRFRCVSKSWLSLIEKDQFIKIHMQNSRKYGVIYNVKRDVLNGRSLQPLLHSNPKEGSSSSSSSTSTSISIAPTNNPPKGTLVGSCNGLLCLSHNFPDGNFMLWNPATRVSMELPKLDNLFPKCGFGWDESSGAYKIFATMISCSNHRPIVSGHVYSSKTNSWKTVPLGSIYLFNFIGLFLHGRIHWAMGIIGYGEEHAIESFDLESDEFGRIELPPFNANANGFQPSTKLGKIEGCLCTLVEYKESAEVWVMKEYGVKDSWFKRLAFPLDECLCNTPKVDVSPPAIGEGPDGEMFINCRNILMVYSPKHGFYSKVADFNYLTGVHVYAESLVSPRRILGGTKIIPEAEEEEEEEVS